MSTERLSTAMTDVNWYYARVYGPGFGEDGGLLWGAKEDPWILINMCDRALKDKRIEGYEVLFVPRDEHTDGNAINAFFERFTSEAEQELIRKVFLRG